MKSLAFENSSPENQASPQEPIDAIAIDNVRKVFRSDILKGPQVAVDNLSLRFRAGRCTGLLGHNGAGKTTTIRMILGLIKPDRGRILFEGRPLKTRDKRWIGFMPETNKLPGILTPEEVLRYALALHAPPWANSTKVRRELIAKTLDDIGLLPHRKKRIKHLSKGMGRRLAWALATIHKPRLLILDEPASGLDPLARREMLQRIADVKAAGTSIILCTHELAQVTTLCDDVHVMKQGRVVYTFAEGGEKSAGDEPSPEAPRYQLHVSGADEERLRKLGKAHGLPPWDVCRQEGYLAILRFAHYGSATTWLATLIQAGYVIPRFGDEGDLSEEDLLKYF